MRRGIPRPFHEDRGLRAACGAHFVRHFSRIVAIGPLGERFRAPFHEGRGRVWIAARANSMRHFSRIVVMTAMHYLR